MSSYLISHNHPLYILLTGTGKIMDNSWIRNCVAGSPTFCEDFGPYDRLIPFMKEQEGSIKYQTNISKTFDPTTNEFIAYKDKADKFAIGYGHTQNVKPGDRISIQEANQLLRTDIKTNATTVNKLLKERYGKTLPEFNEAGKFLLIDMAFNIGPEGLTNKETGWKNMINGLVNHDWVTVSQEYTATNTPERNKARFKEFIEPHLIAMQSFQGYKGVKPLTEKQQRAKPDTPDKVELSDKFKQYEEEARRKKEKVEKGIYKSLPTLLHSIQTKNIPTDKVQDYIGAYASSELYKKIEDKVPQIVKDLGVKGKIKDLDEYEFSLLGYQYKHEPGEQSVSGKGFTYTQTDEQKRLEKKFGKKGDITGSIGISKSDVGDEKTIGGQINIPIHKIFKRRRKRR